MISKSKKKEIVILIPAKGKSSRVSNKNLRKYKGQSLILRTILQSKKVIKKENIFVSSDSKRILNIAASNGVRQIKRSKSLCLKKTTANEVIKDFIKKNLKNFSKKTILVYLQPTSPKRSYQQIKMAIQEFTKSKMNSLISFYESNNKDIAKSYFYLKKKIEPIRKDFANHNDQDIPKIFVQNGAIYIFTIDSFNKKNCIPQNKIYPFLMSRKSSLDINTLKDFNL